MERLSPKPFQLQAFSMPRRDLRRKHKTRFIDACRGDVTGLPYDGVAEDLHAMRESQMTVATTPIHIRNRQTRPAANTRARVCSRFEPVWTSVCTTRVATKAQASAVMT